MSTATDGRRTEHLIRDALISDGYTMIMRAAGSKGAGDLLLAKPGEILLVQCGRGTKRLGPADRDRFVTAASLLGATPILATKAPRQPIVYRQVDRLGYTPWTPDQVAA